MGIVCVGTVRCGPVTAGLVVLGCSVLGVVCVVTGTPPVTGPAAVAGIRPLEYSPSSTLSLA